MKKLFILTIILFLITDVHAAPSDHFVTTWETTASDTVITIPTVIGETYNYAIDWDNDMIPDQTGVTGDAVHDYGSAGVHTIRIFGTFPRIYINSGVEKDKILSIDQWGTNAWTSMNKAFDGASNLVNNALDTPNLSNCTNLSFMFVNATNIGNGMANWNWDTSNISSLSSMFISATSFDEDISSWNVINVTNFFNMFAGVTLSSTNYDALLISWDAQVVKPNISFNGGFSQYCSLDAQNARASLIANDTWTITDGGHTFACDILFKNSFEEVIIVKTAKQQISYDFSEVTLDTLDQEPHLIVKGMDDNNKENMRIYIRNDLGTLQVQVSYLIDDQWIKQQWLDIDNTKTITLQW